MKFDEIMKEITSGLSGNPTEDIEYLHEKMNLYKEHEMAKEILRACGRIITDLIPEDKKEELTRLIGNDIKAIEETLDEIHYNIYKKDFDKAMKISEGLVASIEESEMFENDEVSEYYNFNEFFEQVLYIHYNEPTKTVRIAEIPYSKVYLQHGSLLFELERYQEAKEVLAKARRWNPADTAIAFEYMETFKALNELEEFFKLTKDTFKYAFKKEDVARCYRNLGYYFVEKQLYEVAVGCYLLSLEYEKNRSAQSELYYIQQVAPEEVKDPTIEELERYAEEYGFNLGVDEDVVGFAYTYGMHFMKDGEKDGALYCFEIVNNLIDDEDIKKIIDELKS